MLPFTVPLQRTHYRYEYQCAMLKHFLMGPDNDVHKSAQPQISWSVAFLYMMTKEGITGFCPVGSGGTYRYRYSHVRCVKLWRFLAACCRAVGRPFARRPPSAAPLQRIDLCHQSWSLHPCRTEANQKVCQIQPLCRRP